MRIDFDGLQQRIVGLPVAERNYTSLDVASDGALFYLERAQPGASKEPPDAESSGNGELYRFNFEDRKAKSLKQNVANFSVSADGKKLLLQYAKGKLEIADAAEKLDAKALDLSQLGMTINPPEEWLQIFNETWWMQKWARNSPRSRAGARARSSCSLAPCGEGSRASEARVGGCVGSIVLFSYLPRWLTKRPPSKNATRTMQSVLRLCLRIMPT